VPTILNLSRAGKPLEVTNPYQPVEKQFTLTINLGRGGFGVSRTPEHRH
jgi:hypothetical protein